MNLPNLNDLAIFVRVIEHSSFSATARELNLAPKLISARIARLEQALATTLFERNTRNLRITDEGRAIAERARAALALLDDIQEVASNGNHELRGTIRLTAPAPFGRKFIAPAIGDFHRQHPQVNFDLRLSDQVVDLYAGDLDLGIRIGELADSRLIAQRIADNHRVLVASPGYLAEHGTPVQPDELIQHQCLIFAYPGLLQNTWLLKKGRREKAIALQGGLSSDSGDVLHSWCMAGLGISLRETWDIHEQLRAGQLVRVLPGWQAAASRISLVRTRRQPVPQRLRVFMDFLLERWRDAPWDSE